MVTTAGPHLSSCSTEDPNSRMLHDTAPRIVFTGDFLHPCEARFASARLAETVWLHRLLAPLVQRVSGQPPAMVGWGAGSSPQHNLTSEVIAAIYADCEAPLTQDGWAALYDRAKPCLHLEALVQEHFAGALVIGWKLPPIIQRALLRAQAHILDVRLHPAGFLDDALLAFRASSPELQARLDKHAMPEDMLRLMAGLASAAAASRTSLTPKPDSLLILADELPGPGSISGGRFARLADFRAKVVSLAALHTSIYLHAGIAATPELALLREWGIAVEVTDAPLYTLLAHPNISRVLALDADRAGEASFFGKAVHGLLPPTCPLNRGDAHPANYVGISDAILTTEFWANLLNRPNGSATTITVPHRPNRLRLSLGQLGEYHRIDSDTYVSAALLEESPQDGHPPSFPSMQHNAQALDADLRELRNDQVASSTDTRARLAFLEQELSRTQAALEVMNRWQADEMTYRKRSLPGRLLFRQNGRPTRSLRTLLFHASGKPRGLFRAWIIDPQGEPRKWLRQWMTSADYLALAKAHHSPSVLPALPPARPFTAWRSVAGASDLNTAALDTLMGQIRAEVQASQAQAMQVPAHG